MRFTNNDDKEFYKNKCKQLEAENHELRMHITAFTYFRALDFDLIERLKAENEKLKENLSEVEAIMLTYRTEKEEFEILKIIDEVLK